MILITTTTTSEKQSNYTVYQKKWTTKFMAITLSNLNQNQNSFTVRLRYKFAVKPITLRCEICLQEITMLKNCVNKLPPTTQTAMQYSATDYCSKKNTLTRHGSC